MSDQARIDAIRKYFNSYKGQFSEDSLRQQLLNSGYTQEEIEIAVLPNAQPQQELQQQPQNGLKTLAENQQNFNQNFNNSFTNQEGPNVKKIIKIVSIIAIIAALVGGGWWATTKFIFYKGIKNGNFEIDKVIKNKEHDEVIVKIEKIESTKEKVKLYITIENNLDNKEYYMYGDILGSFKVKDQDNKPLKAYKKDYKQEKGGELDTSNITLKPGEEASGWVSFINPTDKRITAITIEGDEDMFGKTEEIKL